MSTHLLRTTAAVCAVFTFGATMTAQERAVITADYDSSWSSNGAGSIIQQTQFGGFLPPLSPFPQPPIATTTPLQDLFDRPAENVFERAPTTARRERLSRTPDMFGDTLLPPAVLFVQEAGRDTDPQTNQILVGAPLPNGGAAARTRIGEHNKPLPTDRVYFNYNHFHNAIERRTLTDGVDQRTQRDSVDRFTMGLERTWLAGVVSTEVRVPLSASPDLKMTSAGGTDIRSSTGTLGNLSLIGKGLILNSDDILVSTGLAVDLPTGRDATLRVADSVYTLENETVYLHPFAGVMWNGTDFFLHSFLELDVPVNESSLTVNDRTGGNSLGTVGDVMPQNLLHWDITAGRWLMRTGRPTGLTGLAAISEFHVSTALDKPEQLNGVRNTPNGPSRFALQSSAGRFTAMHITTGLHAQLGTRQSVRVAAVLPLRDGINRFFDAEFVVQLGSRY